MCGWMHERTWCVVCGVRRQSQPTQLRCPGERYDRPPGVTNRKRSWPAVSHICNLIDLPPQLTTLDPNSTPMVCEDSDLTVGHSKVCAR